MASPIAFAQDAIRCSLCENCVEYYCNSCHSNLCSDCTSTHLSDTIKIHKIVNFSSKRENHDCTAEGQGDCEIFCRDCEIPVCVTCVVDVHKQHDLTELDIVLQEKRNKLAGDIRKMECRLLRKIQTNSMFDDEEYEKVTEEIFQREEVICSAVHDFAGNLLEKVAQHKKENEEKENQIKTFEEKKLKDIQETELLLLNGDSEVIYQFDGIKKEWKYHQQEYEIILPFLNTNTLQEKDLASLFGQLVFKPTDWKDKKKSIVRGGNLKKEAWFHGYITREEAEQLLLKDGDFLVRESKNSTESDRCFVISTYRQRPVHVIIRNNHIREICGSEATVVDYISFLKLSRKSLSKSTASSTLENAIARRESQLVYDEILIESNERYNKVQNNGMLYRGIYGSAMVYIQKWENQDQAFKNLGLLRKFNHPNIIRLIGYSALERPILLVMEYLPGGILLRYLREKRLSISKGKRIQMCKDVASGMNYLHHNGYIHRDLAARNCSVNEKTVKISNFWMTEFGTGYQVTKTSNIPVKWTAPEVFQLEKCTFLSDVWSFGILMWEIFSSGELPYEGLTIEQIMEKVTSGYKMPPPKGTPKKCYELMLSCWKRNPDNRYNFTKIEEKLQEIVKKHQAKYS